MGISSRYLLLTAIILILLANHANAFGAGNIASISSVEGKNWRHGDIEDMLKHVAFLKHHKWTSMMIKRVYFGNWLRDYSQAVDVGTLKGVPKDTIRLLVWILSFMSFGYATAEFEVTEERLGTYRPEEHIDNPRDYADNVDARQYDPRLRPPVRQIELEIDPASGMKNYIANERGDWATSVHYVKDSFARSIHYGRAYASQSGFLSKGNEADLCEALRCLGQGLHCLEDFGAHTNYVELCLREMGFTNVFPHVGTNAGINLNGRHVFPLVTGTFGGVDFLHSVLGEATDHVTQTEVDEMQKAMDNASATAHRGVNSPEQSVSGLTDLLSKVPGTGDLCREAVDLQRASDAQADANYNESRAGPSQFAAPPKFDAVATMKKIYPILEFRDNVVRAISSVVSKIPGLESLVEKIQETITLFIMGLLSPYITPIITAATQQLKVGSTTVVNASGRHQYEVWTDPNCSDPTHSLLSKDHFSNILNQPAGEVASEILQYCAPRVIYAWDHPEVPVEQVMADISEVFHHPAARRPGAEVQQKMWSTVERWVHTRPGGSRDLHERLSSESVKAGNNHTTGQNPHQHGQPGLDSKIFGGGSHSKVSGSPFDMFGGQKGGQMDEPYMSSTGTPASLQIPGAFDQPTGYSSAVSNLQSQAEPQNYPPRRSSYHSQGPATYPEQDLIGHSTTYNQGYSHSSFQSQDQSTYPPRPQAHYGATSHDSNFPQSQAPYQSATYDSNAYPGQQAFSQQPTYHSGGYSTNPDPFGQAQLPPPHRGDHQYYEQDPNNSYPSQGQSSYQQDPNNPYPSHQQGFGGGGY